MSKRKTGKEEEEEDTVDGHIIIYIHIYIYQRLYGGKWY